MSRKKKQKNKLKDSSGNEIIKIRGITKPPMVEKDKTKYSRKKKFKKIHEEI